METFDLLQTKTFVVAGPRRQVSTRWKQHVPHFTALFYYETIVEAHANLPEQSLHGSTLLFE